MELELIPYYIGYVFFIGKIKKSRCLIMDAKQHKMFMEQHSYPLLIIQN